MAKTPDRSFAGMKQLIARLSEEKQEEVREPMTTLTIKVPESVKSRLQDLAGRQKESVGSVARMILEAALLDLESGGQEPL